VMGGVEHTRDVVCLLGTYERKFKALANCIGSIQWVLIEKASLECGIRRAFLREGGRREKGKEGDKN